MQPLSHYTFGGVSQGTFTGSFQDTGTANNPLFTTGGNGSPTVIPGPLGGQAVQFPGNLQANYIPAYGALTSYTVSNWVNLANGDGGAWQTRGGDNNFGVDAYYWTGNNGEIHNEIYTTGSSWLFPDFQNQSQILSGWNLITLTVGSGTWTEYLNGTALGSGSYSGDAVFMEPGESLWVGTTLAQAFSGRLATSASMTAC